MSIKSIIAAIASSPFLFAVAAFAGPYVNVESKLQYHDGDHSEANTELHIVYEGSLSENADFYAQIGPAFGAVDGTDGSEGEISGKVGVNVAATENIGVYGEISGVTAEANNDDVVNWGAKLGAKFTF